MQKNRSVKKVRKAELIFGEGEKSMIFGFLSGDSSGTKRPTDLKQRPVERPREGLHVGQEIRKIGKAEKSVESAKVDEKPDFCQNKKAFKCTIFMR
jgi:hypothetical protein